MKVDTSGAPLIGLAAIRIAQPVIASANQIVMMRGSPPSIDSSSAADLARSLCWTVT